MSGKTTMYRQQQAIRKQAFSSALTRRMSLAGLDQISLAEATGIPHDQISRYCNAYALPRPKNQERLAKALGCSRTDLMSHTSLPAGSDEYMSFRNSNNDRVTLELRKQVSLDQAHQIMQILGSQGVTA